MDFRIFLHVVLFNRSPLELCKKTEDTYWWDSVWLPNHPLYTVRKTRKWVLYLRFLLGRSQVQFKYPIARWKRPKSKYIFSSFRYFLWSSRLFFSNLLILMTWRTIPSITVLCIKPLKEGVFCLLLDTLPILLCGSNFLLCNLNLTGLKGELQCWRN